MNSTYGMQIILHVCFFLEIPVIPDLDDFQEEDLTNKIAAPPRFVNAAFLKI